MTRYTTGRGTSSVNSMCVRLKMLDLCQSSVASVEERFCLFVDVRIEISVVRLRGMDVSHIMRCNVQDS